VSVELFNLDFCTAVTITSVDVTVRGRDVRCVFTIIA